MDRSNPHAPAEGRTRERFAACSVSPCQGRRRCLEANSKATVVLVDLGIGQPCSGLAVWEEYWKGAVPRIPLGT